MHIKSNGFQRTKCCCANKPTLAPSLNDELSQEYCIAGNFRGAKYSWFFMVTMDNEYFNGMKGHCLPLPAVQAATTKY